MIESELRSSLMADTERLELELGPCLLLVKCYELLGDRHRARTTARGVVQGELQRLSKMSSPRYTFRQRSEQILRAIYSLVVAEEPAPASVLFARLMSEAEQERTRSGLLRGEDALRLAVAEVVASAKDRRVLALLAPGEEGPRVARAWESASSTELAEVCSWLEGVCEAGENVGSMAPAQDGWLCILLVRLQGALARGPG